MPILLPFQNLFSFFSETVKIYSYQNGAVHVSVWMMEHLSVKYLILHLLGLGNSFILKCFKVNPAVKKI